MTLLKDILSDRFSPLWAESYSLPFVDKNRFTKLLAAIKPKGKQTAPQIPHSENTFQ